MVEGVGNAPDAITKSFFAQGDQWEEELISLITAKTDTDPNLQLIVAKECSPSSRISELRIPFEETIEYLRYVCTGADTFRQRDVISRQTKRGLFERVRSFRVCV